MDVKNDRVTLTPAARRILDTLLVTVDEDPRIPRAYSEEDMIEFALRFFEYCDLRLPPTTPIFVGLHMTLKDFEDARKDMR